MSVSRYNRDPVLSFGRKYGSTESINAIRSAIKNGDIPYTTMFTRGAERLDTIAGEVYGDASYWWILAAASDIGWGLQVPSNTIILVPVLSKILQYVG